MTTPTSINTWIKQRRTTPEINGYFLGPQSENAALERELMKEVLEDYESWRKNHFPADQPLLDDTHQTLWTKYKEDLQQTIHNATAELRSHFPFYSSRYVAHQLGDQTIASRVGLFAGMLYNPNNVTEEAAPVTVRWELEVGRDLVRMAGFRPNDPDKDNKQEDLSKAVGFVRKRFGWAHLTGGGSVANLEGLWWARTLRYLPVALADGFARWYVSSPRFKQAIDDRTDKSAAHAYFPYALRKARREASQKGTDGHHHQHSTEPLDLLEAAACVYRLCPPGWPAPAQGPRPTAADAEHWVMQLRALADRPGAAEQERPTWHSAETAWRYLQTRVFSLTPRQSLDLVYGAMECFDGFCSERSPTSSSDVPATVMGWVKRSPYFVPTHGTLAAFKLAEPVVFVSGTGHYSCPKALDVLGLDRYQHLIHPEIDHRCRMKVEGLREELGKVDKSGPKDGERRVPLAVICIAGSTEEGSVDPIDQIAQLRDERRGWDFDETGIPKTIGTGRRPSFWMHVDAAWGGYIRSLFVPDRDRDPSTGKFSINAERVATAKEYIDHLVGYLPSSDIESDLAPAQRVAKRSQLIRQAGRVVSTTVPEDLVWYSTLPQEIRWDDDPGEPVRSALYSIDQADSVTIDPHKMGYVPYPAGAIVLGDDRILPWCQKTAPYIFKGSTGELDLKPEVGPYIIEGSKPGSTAASVWVSHRVIPPTRSFHGQIVRATLLTARRLHHYLSKDKLYAQAVGALFDNTERASGNPHSKTPSTITYRVVPFIDEGPDTNIVCFGIAPNDPALSRDQLVHAAHEVTLAASRLLTVDQSYAKSTHDDWRERYIARRQSMYAQEFFLSSTAIKDDEYPAKAMTPFLRRLAGICSTDMDPAPDALLSAQYRAIATDNGKGLCLLRVVITNPYIQMALEHGMAHAELKDAAWHSLDMGMKFDYILRFVGFLHEVASLCVLRCTSKSQESPAVG